jgi:hypothetical protein
VLKFVATIRAGCWLECGGPLLFFSLPQQCASVGSKALMLSLPAVLFVRCGICILRPSNPSFSAPSLKTGAPDLPDSQWGGVGCVFRYPLITMPTKHVVTKIARKASAREFRDPTRLELVDFPSNRR